MMVDLDDSRLSNSAEAMPVEMEAPMAAHGGGNVVALNSEAVNNVLYSEIGINVLLNRLKQSIASVKDFSGFLQKRAKLEEAHAQGLSKLASATNESVRRGDGRQGSYAARLLDVCRVHERISEHGTTFASSLTQMHTDLDKLVTTMEHGRKHWKQEGTANEKKVKDAESALEKAKSKYDSLADDYDKARTGGSSSGRVLTIKGPKSAEKHEEDLHKKLQSADSDYSSKVQGAQVARQENMQSTRPQAVKALQELIRECDVALSLQLQKFAAFNEKLLVGNGLEVYPVQGGDRDTTRTSSMRQILQQIDNERDFHNYVANQTSQVPPTPAEIRYQKHPTLGGSSPALRSTPPATASMRESNQQSIATSHSSVPVAMNTTTVQPISKASPAIPQQDFQQPLGGMPPSFAQRSVAAPQPSSVQPAFPPQGPSTETTEGSDAEYNQNLGFSQSRQAPSSLDGREPSYQSSAPTSATYASTTNGVPYAAGPYRGSPASTEHQRQQQAYPTAARTNGAYGSSPRASPSRPVFGQSLETLFRRDDTAIPMVVLQCIQAVDLYGLNVEGIYRLSGNVNHINQLKAAFDHDSKAAGIDFRNPESFSHDINSVASLLKQFFRELPDPLFTAEHYGHFIDAARIEDDNQRRDSVHAVINELPDPNYATLRAMVLHLHRVGEHAQSNRMSTHNLAICFAPTLMGQHAGPQMADAGLQARAMDTILRNTYQIFDED